MQKILAQLLDHDKRIRTLEACDVNSEIPKTEKEATLAEIVHGKIFKSGQEKIAVIVGYYELILHQSPVNETNIRTGWLKGKLDGKYRSNLLERTVSDALVRDLENGAYDLSQTGEKFFNNFLKSNVGKA